MSDEKIVKKESYYGKIGTGLIIAVLVSGCAGHFATSSITPLMQLIADTWPEYAHLASQAQSLPSLLMVPPVLFVGVIARVISKKYILMFGTMMFFLGGFIPIFFDSFFVMLIGRCFVGLGTGFMVSIPTAIVGQLFEGRKQNSMMGLLNGIGAIIGMAVSAIVGFLALSGIATTYWVFLLMLLFFILQWAFIPKLPPEKNDETMPKIDEQGNKIGIGKKTVIGLIGFFIWKIFVIVFVYVISGVVINQGGGTVADAGLVMTAFTGLSFVWSLLFVPLFNKIHNWVLPFGCIMGICSFGLLSSANSIAMCYLVVIFHSGCMTMMYPWIWKTMSTMSPRVWITTAIAFVSVGSYLGQFAAPYLMNVIISTFGAGAPMYTVYAAIFAIFTVIGIFIVLKDKKSKNQLLRNILDSTAQQ